MGGGPPHETLLLLLPSPLPPSILRPLQTSFPSYTIHQHTYSPRIGGLGASGTPVPPSLYASATILVTLSALPKSLDLVPHLKYVHVLSAGVDWMAKQHEVVYEEWKGPITTVSGIHGPVIAEWVVMVTLGLAKNFKRMVRAMDREDRKWDSGRTGVRGRADWCSFPSNDNPASGGDDGDGGSGNGSGRGAGIGVGDKTVGILGYGSIGRQVARVFKALGSRVHVYTRGVKDTAESRRDDGYTVPGMGDVEGVLPDMWYSEHSGDPGAGENGKKGGKTGLHTFLASGLDMLLISVPLVEGTRGLIGKEEIDILYRDGLERAKRSPFYHRTDKSSDDGGEMAGESEELPDGFGCILVNISRGPIVVQDELIDALKRKKLMGAALDVTDPEPLPDDSELWKLENCIVTPHISGLSREYVARAFDVLTVNLRNLEDGKALVNEVDRKKGY